MKNGKAINKSSLEERVLFQKQVQSWQDCFYEWSGQFL
jgi:hypothetical protein